MTATQPRGLILQIPSTAETAAARQATYLAESSAFAVLNARLETLADHAEALRVGAVPIGSVEFVREAMAIAGIQEPPNISYPEELRPWLHREVRTDRLDAVKGRAFIKPTTTKLFTGFVYDPAVMPSPEDPHGHEQDRVVRSLPGCTLVHTSQVVEFQCEWRFYIQDGKILGGARYDADGADDAPAPNMNTLTECVRAMGTHRPFSLDVGVLADGHTALVEANDGWSIGLYRGAITPGQYLGFLISCWDSLLRNRA